MFVIQLPANKTFTIFKNYNSETTMIFFDINVLIGMIFAPLTILSVSCFCFVGKTTAHCSTFLLFFAAFWSGDFYQASHMGVVDAVNQSKGSMTEHS